MSFNRPGPCAEHQGHTRSRGRWHHFLPSATYTLALDSATGGRKECGGHGKCKLPTNSQSPHCQGPRTSGFMLGLTCTPPAHPTSTAKTRRMGLTLNPRHKGLSLTPSGTGRTASGCARASSYQLTRASRWHLFSSLHSGMAH